MDAGIRVIEDNRSRRCYICHCLLDEWKEGINLCPSCLALNNEKRAQLQRRDDSLEGRFVLVTGGRIKIGFETALSLLRKKAKVMITTRFPADAAKRYASEEDFEQWADNLTIYGIDFRNILLVNKMIDWMNVHLPYLDILINNAAQTIARPEEYYSHLNKLEHDEFSRLAEVNKRMLIVGRALSLQKETKGYLRRFFPEGIYDEEGMPLDLRRKNSWTERLWDVSVKEFLEVQLINVTVPFMLCSRLVDLMRKSPRDQKYVINVSAMEGRFSKYKKNGFHPHTNMAKAALNMMTRTAAEDYRKMNIYMNSVDTGWVTDENPVHIKKKNQRGGLCPPLDCIDGAARICDPFLVSIYDKNRMPRYGEFLKDFHRIKNW